LTPFLSIVSPVYRAELIIEKLVAEIKASIVSITDNYEILLVEDGSPDNSWDSIMAECRKDPRVKGIKLSRNFGQHYAITAGLDHTKGEWIVVMDCDLQDLPEEIPNLLEEAKKGYDIVLARRAYRRDHVTKKFFSSAFYRVLGYLTGSEQDAAVANYGIYHRRVIDAVCSMREQIRYFPTMIKWVGFKKTLLDVKHGSRDSGASNYNMRKLMNLAFDILLANSEKPIKLIVKMGFLISMLAFVASLIVMVQYFRGAIEVAGYTSLVLSIWLLGGLVIMLLGIIGMYVGKVFQYVKDRPIYIIQEQKNLHEN